MTPKLKLYVLLAVLCLLPKVPPAVDFVASALHGGMVKYASTSSECYGCAGY